MDEGMINRDERIDDLLVDWEADRLDGRTLTAKELCRNDPDLVDAVSARIAVLKDLSWVADPDEMVSDDVSPAEDSDTLPNSDVTEQEFLKRLSNSGLLNDADIERANRVVSSDPKEKAKTLAERLIAEDLITSYQAKVILERGDSPLLLDRYVILDSIGAGGMGIVFKALQRSLDRVVALKVLPPAATDSPEKVERFQREMRAAAKLSHPNVVQAFDAHESNGIYFLAMEYVAGQNLTELVASSGPLPVDETIEIIKQSAAGLDTAHAHGIVHRDVKPSNIVLANDGTAKVMDLGLARTREQTQQSVSDELTREGLAMGTFGYMAPEQAFDAKSADERSDVYSLGCTLYFLMHGKSLFNKSNSVQTVLAHREHPAPKLGEGRSDVPHELEALFQSMVAKDPADRPQSMQAVQDALQEELLGEQLPLEHVTAHEIDPQTSAAVASSLDSPLDAPQKSNAWWKIPVIGLIAALLGGVYLATQNMGLGVGANGQASSAMRDTAIELLNTEQFSLVAAVRDDEFIVDFVDELPSDNSFDVVGVLVYPPRISDDKSDGLRLQRLNAFPNLSSITVGATEESDDVQVESLRRLQFPKLADLAFSDCEIGSIAGIESNHELSVVSFISCRLPEDMGPLSSLPNLSVLSLVQSELPGSAWLSQLKQLEYLDLRNSNVSSDCLEHLLALEKLATLGLSGCEMKASLRLAEMKQLVSLSVDATDFDDSMLEQVLQMEQLQVVDLSHTKVTPSGLAKLVNLRELSDLSLAGLSVKPAIKDLAKMRRLTTLNVDNTDFDDECLEVVSKLPRLTTIFAEGVTLSDAALDRLSRTSPDCQVIFESDDDAEFFEFIE